MSFTSGQDIAFKYHQMFGDIDLDLPTVLDIVSLNWNCPEKGLEEVGRYLGECVKKNEKASVRGYVDFFYLTKEGFYEAWGIKEKSYEKFMALAKKASENVIL